MCRFARCCRCRYALRREFWPHWQDLLRYGRCRYRSHNPAYKGHLRANRPNQLWVSDFTYVSTWLGWQYVVIVIDVYARQPGNDGSLIHHSDRGSQYVSVRYTERLAQAGIESSVGSRGDGYDNALAETINGLYKAEVIHRRGLWKNRQTLELVTLEWVDWFNTKRLHSFTGYTPRRG